MPTLSWRTPEDRDDALNAIHDSVVQYAEQQIDWYLYGRKRKKSWAIRLRAGAIVFGALAALLPFASQLVDGLSSPAPALRLVTQPIIASVLLAVAGTLVLVDRFFGHSTGWMRYIRAEMHISGALHRFRLEWQTYRATTGSATPDAAGVAHLVGLARAFFTEVHGVMQEETQEWITEFQRSLQQVDEHVRTRAEAAEPGALNVRVVGPAEGAEWWELWIGEAARGQFRGASAVVPALAPGIHAVRVTARVNDRELRAEEAVRLAPREIRTVELRPS